MKNETYSPGFLAAVWPCIWLSLSNGMWEDMICTTSSLCLEGEGHAHLFPFSSYHELECQDIGQPSWTIRCKSWVRRTEQQAKIPTMTYEVLCDSAIPKPSGLHWSVHYRNTDWSLCCSPRVKHSLARGTLYCWKPFPHISSWVYPHSLQVFTQIPPFQWDILTTLSRISTVSTPPSSSYPHTYFIFPHSTHRSITCWTHYCLLCPIALLIPLDYQLQEDRNVFCFVHFCVLKAWSNA